MPGTRAATRLLVMIGQAGVVAPYVAGNEGAVLAELMEPRSCHAAGIEKRPSNVKEL
jgi:hypothetical protein